MKIPPGLFPGGVFYGTFCFVRDEMTQKAWVGEVLLKMDWKKTRFGLIDSCKIKTL